VTQDQETLPYRLGEAVLRAVREAAEAGADVLITCEPGALSIFVADGRHEEVRVRYTEQDLVTYKLDDCA
jgi:hypothetical protein